jgi:hypothetical protein
VPLESVIDFKRDVYRLGLEQLAGFLEVPVRGIGLSPYGRRRRPNRGPRPAPFATPSPIAAADTEV